MSSYNVKKHVIEEIAKAQYYVWYLGWKECRGLAGREFTEPIVKDLVIRRKNDDLPKLTIEVSKRELKVYQQTRSKFGRSERIKFPTVPAKDVTYAVQALPPDEDVVACIYLGFNPTTRRAVHIHVYRCDAPSTAAALADHLMEIVRLPEHEDRIKVIEEQLSARGEITPRPRNFINSFDSGDVSRTPSTVHTHLDNTLDISDSGSDGEGDDEDPYSLEKEERMETLANELRARLGSKTKAPILLPPQDYDTVRRVRGNLDLEDYEQYESRKCHNENIIGAAGVKQESDTKGNNLNALFRENGSGNSDINNSDNRERSQHSLEKMGKSTDSEGNEQRDSDIVHPMSPRWMAGDPGYQSKERTRSIPMISHQNSLDSNGHPQPGSPRRSGSPTPRYYNDGRRGRAASPRRTDKPRYLDESQYIVPQYPAGMLPPPGNPQGVMVPPGMVYAPDPNYGRLPRQLSDTYPPPELYEQSNPTASMPSSLLEHHTHDASRKDKRKKKHKKGKRTEEPPPDYTIHPSEFRKSGVVFT